MADKVHYPIFFHFTYYNSHPQACCSARPGSFLICRHTRPALASEAFHLHFLLVLPSATPWLTASPVKSFQGHLLIMDYPVKPRANPSWHTSPCALLHFSLQRMSLSSLTQDQIHIFFMVIIISSRTGNIEVCCLQMPLQVSCGT